MPRRSLKRAGNLGDASPSDDASSSEEFLSPDEPEDVTNYGLRYSPRRIINPFQPSTSRAATGGWDPSVHKQPTARKKTNQTPEQHLRAPTERVSAAKKVTGASRRKKSVPLRNRTILQLRQTTDFLIPRLPFGRLVREIIMNVSRGTHVNRITRIALEALQESLEMYLVQQLQDAYTLTLHRGRVTLAVKDLELLRFLRGYI